MYKVIAECMVMVQAHMKKFFDRQRDEMVVTTGGYGKVNPRAMINLMVSQNQTLDSMMSIVYWQAFEFFPLDERVFAAQLEKELGLYR